MYRRPWVDGGQEERRNGTEEPVKGGCVVEGRDKGRKRRGRKGKKATCHRD